VIGFAADAECQRRGLRCRRSRGCNYADCPERPAALGCRIGTADGIRPRSVIRLSRRSAIQTAASFKQLSLVSRLAPQSSLALAPSEQRVSDGYVSSVATCSSRAYCEGGRPTCRVKATLKVLAEL
jgi:hypothetical protein